MATSVNHTRGYQCDVIDVVSEDFYCKKCSLVARSLTICSHCMESFCYHCIKNVKEQGQPCPTCGEEYFQAMPHVKYQKKMKELRVYCSLKEMGCGWSGKLEQLDTHLDPDQDNCQYVDTKCPLDCDVTFPKTNLKHHVSKECVKRPSTCQYCSLKATYEELKEKHLPECKKVILPCPNKCGEEFERGTIEDHKMKCPLEEIECEFSVMGCEERFKREDREEHARQDSNKHLTLMASLAKQLQQKLEEQQRKHREEEATLKKKMEGERKLLERKIEAHEKIIKKQGRQMDDQCSIIEELGMKMEEQQARMSKLENRLEEQGQTMEEQKLALLEQLPQPISVKTLSHKTQEDNVRMSRANSEQRVEQAFEIKNYSTEVRKKCSSPTMYTCLYGYKFFAQVYVSALNYLCMTLFSVPGEYDNELQWPARVKFSIKLLNQQGGEDAETPDIHLTWNQPHEESKINNAGISIRFASRLDDYVVLDTLLFRISSTQLS